MARFSSRQFRRSQTYYPCIMPKRNYEIFLRVSTRVNYGPIVALTKSIIRLWRRTTTTKILCHNMIKIIPATMSTETVERVPSKTKSVSFKSTVRVYPCLHINDYTTEEVTACFLSRKEMSSIKNDLRATLQLICDTLPFTEEEGSEICSRGLEPMLPQGAMRRHRRREAVSAVLKEQQAQRDNKEYDTDLIADAYTEFTCISERIARKMAKEDEKFVLNEQAKEPFCQSRRNAIYRKTSRSKSLTSSRQGSKRRVTTSGSVLCVQ